MTLLAPKVSPAAGTSASHEVFQASLANCEREPIHNPGSIQPLGALLTFATASGIIKHASTNLGQWLQLEMQPVAGRSLSKYEGTAHFLVTALRTYTSRNKLRDKLFLM